jgi:hypothetical protein
MSEDVKQFCMKCIHPFYLKEIDLGKSFKLHRKDKKEKNKACIFFPHTVTLELWYNVFLIGWDRRF